MRSGCLWGGGSGWRGWWPRHSEIPFGGGVTATSCTKGTAPLRSRLSKKASFGCFGSLSLGKLKHAPRSLQVGAVYHMGTNLHPTYVENGEKNGDHDKRRNRGGREYEPRCKRFRSGV